MSESGDMPSAEILERAIGLLHHPTAETAGLWPRATAVLTRQALEVARHDEVKVVRHQAVREHVPSPAPGREPQQLSEQTQVLVVAVDLLASDSSARHVVRTDLGKRHARPPCHHRRAYGRRRRSASASRAASVTRMARDSP